MSEVDGGHPTLAKLTLYAVAALQGCVQAGDGVGHGLTPQFPGSDRNSGNNQLRTIR